MYTPRVLDYLLTSEIFTPKCMRTFMPELSEIETISYDINKVQNLPMV